MSAGSQPAQFADILQDNEDTKIIGAWITGKNEKADFLGTVRISRPDQFFAVAEDELHLFPLHVGGNFVRFLVFRIAGKILGEEYCFQVFHFHFGSARLLGIGLRKYAEAVLLRRKIENRALQPAPIEEGDYGSIPVVRGWGRCRHAPILSMRDQPQQKVTRPAAVPASGVMPLPCISKISFAFAASGFAWNLFRRSGKNTTAPFPSKREL